MPNRKGGIRFPDGRVFLLYCRRFPSLALVVLMEDFGWFKADVPAGRHEGLQVRLDLGNP